MAIKTVTVGVDFRLDAEELYEIIRAHFKEQGSMSVHIELGQTPCGQMVDIATVADTIHVSFEEVENFADHPKTDDMPRTTEGEALDELRTHSDAFENHYRDTLIEFERYRERTADDLERLRNELDLARKELDHARVLNRKLMKANQKLRKGE